MTMDHKRNIIEMICQQMLTTKDSGEAGAGASDQGSGRESRKRRSALSIDQGRRGPGLIDNKYLPDAYHVAGPELGCRDIG